MRLVEAILFDKDGTLFDFAATWGGWARQILDHLDAIEAGAGARVEAAIGFDRAGGVFQSDSVVIAGTAADFAQAVEHLAPAGVDLVALADRFAEDITPVPVPNLISSLEHLGQGRVLGVVTNDSEVPARAHLARHSITHHFDFIAGYDSGYGAKPAPGQLLGFSEATGVRCETTAMVGDSRHDLEAGRAAGMITIGVLTGIAKAEDLSDLADVVLPDISHIAGWLEAR